MHRNKIIILAILLSFIAALPVAGASTTVTLKPIVSATTKAVGEAVAQLTKRLLPPLVELVIGYCQPSNVLSFEITPEHATTKINGVVITRGVTITECEQNGLWTPYSGYKYPKKPFVGVYKPDACAHGMQFVISYCYDELNRIHKNWGPIYIHDHLIDLTDVHHYRNSPVALQWNSVPLQHDEGCTMKDARSCDVEIVDCDPTGRGSTIVGCIYHTKDTQDIVTWKALDKALTTLTKPLPESLSVSDNSSFSSSTSSSSTPQPESPPKKKSLLERIFVCGN